MLDGIKESFVELYDSVFDSGLNEKGSKLPAISRYPNRLGSSELKGMPYIFFAIKEMNYTSSTEDVQELIENFDTKDIAAQPSNYISIYMPIGIQINDNIKYEIQSAGGLLAGLTSGEQVTFQDFLNKLFLEARKELRNQKVVGSAVTAASRQIPVLNPREFVSFQAPTIREFSFSFKFAPTSMIEAIAVKNIIKIFRMSMYPNVNKEATSFYTFPKVFNILFKNTSYLPKLPQCVLTSCSVNYNPNSSSFYEAIDDVTEKNKLILQNFLEEASNMFKQNSNDNIPTEVDMTLSFQEVEPINSDLIRQGY